MLLANTPKPLTFLRCNYLWSWLRGLVWGLFWVVSPVELVLHAQVQTETEPLRVEFSKKTTRQTQPGLVVLVLDHSGSMRSKMGGTGADRNKTRWEASLDDALKRIDSALQVDPGVVDVRVYTFDSNPAVYSRYRPFPRLTRSSGIPLARDALRAIRDPEGETMLYTSVKNIADGLLKDDALGAYGWVQLVLYSDGDDSGFGTDRNSPRRRAAEAAMCAALSELTKSPRFIADYLPIGIQGLDVGCGGLRRTQLNDIKPPTFYNLVMDPNPLRLNGAKPGESIVTPLKMTDFSDPQAVRFQTLGQPHGLELKGEVTATGEGRLVWQLPSEMSEGARFKLVASSPIPDSDNRIHVTNEVAIPPTVRVPAVSSWGLPEICPENGGKRTLVVERGQPVAISLNLPTEAQIKWMVMPGNRSSTGLTFREELPVGTYTIQVIASLPNAVGPVEAYIVAHVIDPTVEIVSGPNAAKDVVAGTEYPLIARLQGSPPPDFILKALEASVGAWRVAGQRQESRGMAVVANFTDFGPMGVDFIAKVPVCRGFVQFRGSLTLPVKPGVSIRLIPTRLIQGYLGSISVEVSDRDQVDHVDVSIDGGRTWIPTQYDTTGRLNAPAKTAPISAADLINASRSGNLDILLRPIRKLPSGLPSGREDPENIKRERKESLALVKPEIEVTFVQPLPGSDAPFDKLLPVEATVSGAERDLVKRVELRLGGGASATKLGELVKAEETVDRTGHKWRHGGFKANATLPQDVQLVAEARDADGQRVGVGSVIVHPRSPRPILVLAGTNQNSISWSGGPENIPNVVVKLVESGSNEPYPDSAVRGVKWQVLGGGLEQVSGADGKSQIATFRPTRRGEAKISATITSPSGQVQPAALLEVKVDPVPLTAENLPKLRLHKAGKPGQVIEKGHGFWVRGSESMDLGFEGEVGAFSARTITLTRAGETRSLSTARGIPFPGLPASWQLWRPAKPVDCAVQVAWIPWGETKEQVVVRDAPFRAVAAPSFIQSGFVLLMALVCIFFAFMASGKNTMLGQETRWLVGDDPINAPLIYGSTQTIGILNKKARFNLFNKVVLVSLPKPNGAAMQIKWLMNKELQSERVQFDTNRLIPKTTSYKSLLNIRNTYKQHSIVVVTPRKFDGKPEPVMFKYTSDDARGLAMQSFVNLVALTTALVAAGICYYLIAIKSWPTS